MKIRTLVITVAVLVVLSVLAYLGNRPEAAPSSDPRVGKPLLDADTATKAARIVVSEKGKSVELDRGADGTWRVASYYGLPADFEKIAHLVQDLNEAKLDRFVTSSADRLAHMEFGDSSIALVTRRASRSGASRSARRPSPATGSSCASARRTRHSSAACTCGSIPIRRAGPTRAS